jgi:prolyl-tRNA editing enzyme YbaK/EbsC (Cys-tRNA(Pro) deacylase)
MSIEKVKEYFKKLNLEDRIYEFETSSATVELAARALGCEEKRIAKTLSFRNNDSVILVVTAGDTKIDNSKFKNFFKAKAKMLAFDETENLVGHKIGGVCPFAVNMGVEIYLDNSLKRFETIFPAAGSANSAVKLTPAELEEYSSAKAWVDVCKYAQN